MKEPQKQPREHLEEYLDGMLNEAEREALEHALREDSELRRQKDLQERIDAGVQRIFPAQTPSAEHLAALRDRLMARQTTAVPSAPPASRTRRLGLAATLAAAVACVALAWWWKGPTATTPYFEPTPLASLYRETVKNGFEPYYECREADRFAATFLRRQGQPLALRPLPPGSRMLGLSYPGGLTRNTTAMLCLVDEQPVMVFVDRLKADQPIAGENRDPGVHVFRETRENLVFYEVTPFSKPRMIRFLVMGNNMLQ